MGKPSPPDGGLNFGGDDANACFAPKLVDDPVATCGFAPSKDAAGPPLPIVSPIIWIETPTVLVKKAYTAKPKRQPVLLKTDQPFDGKGTFTVTSGADKIRFFSKDVGGYEIKSGHVFPGALLSLGHLVYAQGEKPSAAEKDVTLQLSLTPGSNPVNPPVTSKMTSVEVTLDICKSRKARGVDPDLVADKIKKGRTVHVQTAYHHGRAMVIVRKAKPESFSGKLSLSAIDNKVRLFAAADEVAIAGQAVLADPFEVDNATIKAPGLKLWAEGAGISNAVIDTGFKLGIKDADPDGDRVAMTIVQFSKLSAIVFPTEANQFRLANGPVPLHTPLQGGLAAKDYDEGFAVNPPLVLLENSVLAAKKVVLAVNIRPRVPVFWEIKRNVAAAPVGDHPQIIKLSPKPVPTLDKLKVDTLSNSLIADAVGSFHICPFVDCNDTQEFNPYDAKRNLIDREPFIVMNLVLVRAQGFKNNSRVPVHPNTVSPSPPTSATGVGFGSGLFDGNPAHAGVHNDAIVTLIGGGGDGRLALDRVYGGWVNNVTNIDSVARYVQPPAPPNPAVTHDVSAIFASNAVGIPRPPGPIIVTRFVTPAAAPAVLPLDMLKAAPAVIAPPLLDCTNFGNEGTGGNTCVGTEGAVGPPLPTPPTPLPSPPTHRFPVGEDRRIQMYDSPGFGAAASHPVFPGNLTSFRFNVDFRCDLCFWTNIAPPPSPGATGDPACRLYVTVQNNGWFIRFDVTFNLAAGGVATIGARRVEIKVDALPTRLAKPVDKVTDPVEVRFPIAIRAWSLDART